MLYSGTMTMNGSEREISEHAPLSPNGETVVVWFDGVCNLCNGFVDFLIRRDRSHHIRYGTLQSQAGRRVCSEHGLDSDNPPSMVLTGRGRVLFRSAAVLAAVRELGRGWKLVAVFSVIPRPLRDAIYDMVARNRYRIFGRRVCRVPSPQERERFIGDCGMDASAGPGTEVTQ